MESERWREERQACMVRGDSHSVNGHSVNHSVKVAHWETVPEMTVSECLVRAV